MKSRTIARFGIIAAIIVAAYFLDAAISRFVPVLGINIRLAVATLIVTLSLCQLFDLKTAVFSTTVFGLMSFTMAYLIPVITSPSFMKPQVSILPRVIVGFVSFGVYRGLSSAFKDSKRTYFRDVFPSVAAGGAGVITNTSLVIGMIAISGGKSVLEEIIIIILSVNFLVEFLCGIIVVPMLVKSLKNNSAIKAMR